MFPNMQDECYVLKNVIVIFIKHREIFPVGFTMMVFYGSLIAVLVSYFTNLSFCG